MKNTTENTVLKTVLHYVKHFKTCFNSRGGIHQEGHTCITFDAVNNAYIDARKRIRE